MRSKRVFWYIALVACLGFYPQTRADEFQAGTTEYCIVHDVFPKILSGLRSDYSARQRLARGRFQEALEQLRRDGHSVGDMEETALLTGFQERELELLRGEHHDALINSPAVLRAIAEEFHAANFRDADALVAQLRRLSPFDENPAAMRTLVDRVMRRIDQLVVEEGNAKTVEERLRTMGFQNYDTFRTFADTWRRLRQTNPERAWEIAFLSIYRPRNVAQSFASNLLERMPIPRFWTLRLRRPQPLTRLDVPQNAVLSQAPAVTARLPAPARVAEAGSLLAIAQDALVNRRRMKARDLSLIDPRSLEFVQIEPGTFEMGSPPGEEGRDNDETPHRVTITQAFQMGKTPVTQALWHAVMGTNPSNFRGRRSADGAFVTVDGTEINLNHPVENVSWEDVQAFIRKLNELDPNHVYRLPTEAEWEYAARAGTDSAYSFGNNANRLREFALFNRYLERTGAVGMRPANPWGLFDMHGNVWEWVQDWYGALSSDAATDPTGAASGDRRVLRGGSWVNGPGGLRSASRSGVHPGYRHGNVGFRLLRTLP